jgi:hypothetical protein
MAFANHVLRLAESALRRGERTDTFIAGAGFAEGTITYTLTNGNASITFTFKQDRRLDTAGTLTD